MVESGHIHYERIYRGVPKLTSAEWGRSNARNREPRPLIIPCSPPVPIRRKNAVIRDKRVPGKDLSPSCCDSGRIFPVFFPVSREFWPERKFAPDCIHRHMLMPPV